MKILKIPWSIGCFKVSFSWESLLLLGTGICKAGFLFTTAEEIWDFAYLDLLEDGKPTGKLCIDFNFDWVSFIPKLEVICIEWFSWDVGVVSSSIVFILPYQIFINKLKVTDKF